MKTNSDDVAFMRGFYKIHHGVLAEELAQKTDDDLAAWQADWKAETANYILAEKEWQRRMLAYEFKLNQRLAEYAARSQRFTAYLGVGAAIIGAMVGAIGSVYLQAADDNTSAANASQTVQKK